MYKPVQAALTLISVTITDPHVCHRVVQVCDHPFLLSDLEPSRSTPHEAVAFSGKLELLDKLLRRLHSKHHKVLLLSHHSRVTPHNSNQTVSSWICMV